MGEESTGGYGEELRAHNLGGKGIQEDRCR